jgi:hypothetical protein
VTRDERLDGWMEALLGARLRFHANAMTIQQAEPIYRRWSQLYHRKEWTNG